jgi:hypothetical protein
MNQNKNSSDKDSRLEKLLLKMKDNCKMFVADLQIVCGLQKLKPSNHM